MAWSVTPDARNYENQWPKEVAVSFLRLFNPLLCLADTWKPMFMWKRAKQPHSSKEHGVLCVSAGCLAFIFTGSAQAAQAASASYTVNVYVSSATVSPAKLQQDFLAFTTAQSKASEVTCPGFGTSCQESSNGE